MKTETRSKKLAVMAVVTAGGLAFLAACSGKSKEETRAAPQLSVIPAPLEVSGDEGSFAFGADTLVAFEGEGAERAARAFTTVVEKTRGLALKVGEAAGATNTILFALNANAPNDEREGYTLRVTPEGVTVAAREASGLYYGGMTLWQLMTDKKDTASIPALTINDSPRFKWRGLMLDSARHFQSVEYVKQFIDWMSMHKMNVLH